MAQFETEWTVVGDAKSWMDALIDAHRSNSPFSKVKLETRTTGSLKRRDLTVLDRDGKICLTGEVKVPAIIYLSEQKNGSIRFGTGRCYN